MCCIHTHTHTHSHEPSTFYWQESNYLTHIGVQVQPLSSHLHLDKPALISAGAVHIPAHLCPTRVGDPYNVQMKWMKARMAISPSQGQWIAMRDRCQVQAGRYEGRKKKKETPVFMRFYTFLQYKTSFCPPTPFFFFFNYYFPSFILLSDIWIFIVPSP